MPTVSKSVLVPYAASRMFELVARVEDYPQFLPWCGGTEVHERTEHGMVATVTIDFKGLRQSFTTENEHEPDRRIAMRLRDGPFSRLDGLWVFTPLREDACKVAFDLDYAFAGALLSRALSPVFDQIAASFVDAFVRRAEAVHG
ncbi:MAG TPA: type II toxin-antitoxin system RatA family toxin [Burkholderiaceae bacterium]|nr:type II toxin-antitoxin system RatA family toxin [Burkholderiaceae bacterium]